MGIAPLGRRLFRFVLDALLVDKLADRVAAEARVHDARAADLVREVVHEGANARGRLPRGAHLLQRRVDSDDEEGGRLVVRDGRRAAADERVPQEYVAPLGYRVLVGAEQLSEGVRRRCAWGGAW